VKASERYVLVVEGVIGVLLAVAEIWAASVFAFGTWWHCPRDSGCQGLMSGSSGGPLNVGAVITVWAPLLVTAVISLALVRHSFRQHPYNPGLVWFMIGALIFNGMILFYGVVIMLPAILLAIMGGFVHLAAGQIVPDPPAPAHPPDNTGG
jgi:hypothetical protein